MTAVLNRVQLIGHLGAKPKVITSKEGNTFVTASIATNESVKKDDEWVTMVEWHQLIFFGRFTKRAEHLNKGSQVYVEGKLRSNSWTDTAGNIQRQANIVVTNVQFLGESKATKEETAPPESNHIAEKHLASMHNMLGDAVSDESVPF